MTRKTLALFDSALLWPTIAEAFKKLDPRVQLRNPVMFVVYIGSIHPLHAQHIRAALLAGKHVLCEKPLTLNAAQAQSLFALARERGLLLAEAMWTRTLPSAQALRKTLADAAPGDGCAG